MTAPHDCTWPATPCAWCEDTANHLQPCGRPGCANYIDDRDPSTGDLAVITDPDDPHRVIEMWHCNLCLVDAYTNLDDLAADSGCGYCIDGWMPVSTPTLGPAYRTCTRCRAACPTCHGGGRFAANLFDVEGGELFYDPLPLVGIAKGCGLRPYFCRTCHGLVVILPVVTGGEQP
jgi:hypothetical protein